MIFPCVSVTTLISFLGLPGPGFGGDTAAAAAADERGGGGRLLTGFGGECDGLPLPRPRPRPRPRPGVLCATGGVMDEALVFNIISPAAGDKGAAGGGAGE